MLSFSLTHALFLINTFSRSVELTSAQTPLAAMDPRWTSSMSHVTETEMTTSILPFLRSSQHVVCEITQTIRSEEPQYRHRPSQKSVSVMTLTSPSPLSSPPSLPAPCHTQTPTPEEDILTHARARAYTHTHTRTPRTHARTHIHTHTHTAQTRDATRVHTPQARR